MVDFFLARMKISIVVICGMQTPTGEEVSYVPPIGIGGIVSKETVCFVGGKVKH